MPMMGRWYYSPTERWVAFSSVYEKYHFVGRSKLCWLQYNHVTRYPILWDAMEFI